MPRRASRIAPNTGNSILFNSRDVAPDPAEDLGALPGAKSAGDLLLGLGYANITFRLKSSYEDFVSSGGAGTLSWNWPEPSFYELLPLTSVFL